MTSTAGHGFELDDIHVRAHLHPGSLCVPVALALGEWRDHVGRLRFRPGFHHAVAAATRSRLPSVSPRRAVHFMRGYHFQAPAAYSGGRAAAHCCASTPAQARHSLGIAGSQAAGLMAAQEGAMAKRLHGGRAAQSGVYAGLLAARGFTGIPNVLEAPYGGFLSSFTDTALPEELAEGLGRRWEILNVGYKPYASAASTHTALYSLCTIMKENGLKAGDIERSSALQLVAKET